MKNALFKKIKTFLIQTQIICSLKMVDGLIGLTGITVRWIVVVAIKPAQEHALIQSQDLMALIVLKMILKLKLAMKNLVR